MITSFFPRSQKFFTPIVHNIFIFSLFLKLLRSSERTIISRNTSHSYLSKHENEIKPTQNLHTKLLTFGQKFFFNIVWRESIFELRRCRTSSDDCEGPNYFTFRRAWQVFIFLKKFWFFDFLGKSPKSRLKSKPLKILTFSSQFSLMRKC